MSNPSTNEPQGCPLPLEDYAHIVIGHGGGGKLSAELVERLFLPAFRNDVLADLGDAAVIPPLAGRLAFSTDTFVVRPLFFPGGSIGELAVNGTVNDLAMRGARPLFLSAGFVLEEGFSISTLTTVVRRMAAAAEAAGVSIVTGDTKVVERGHGDGCFINTSGVGQIPDVVEVGPHLARPGDAVIASGTFADHGMAILSVREGLEFQSEIVSDTAPLAGLVRAMFEVSGEIHVLRDPTRGGVASTLNEIAEASNVGIAVDENRIPVNPQTRAACELLGLDPLAVANEGKLIAVVAVEVAEKLVARMRDHPLGRRAAVIGHVNDRHPGVVVERTVIGGSRVISMQIGEQLPRIC